MGPIRRPIPDCRRWAAGRGEERPSGARARAPSGARGVLRVVCCVWAPSGGSLRLCCVGFEFSTFPKSAMPPRGRRRARATPAPREASGPANRPEDAAAIDDIARREEETSRRAEMALRVARKCVCRERWGPFWVLLAGRRVVRSGPRGRPATAFAQRRRGVGPDIEGRGAVVPWSAEISRGTRRARSFPRRGDGSLTAPKREPRKDKAPGVLFAKTRPRECSLQASPLA